MTAQDRAIHAASRRATADAFDAGRWFSTFCHAPRGSVWNPNNNAPTSRPAAVRYWAA